MLTRHIVAIIPQYRILKSVCCIPNTVTMGAGHQHQNFEGAIQFVTPCHIYPIGSISLIPSKPAGGWLSGG